MRSRSNGELPHHTSVRRTASPIYYSDPLHPPLFDSVYYPGFCGGAHSATTPVPPPPQSFQSAALGSNSDRTRSMSMYATQGDAGLTNMSAATAADLSAMIGQDGNMMNGLDIDMSLPMDLDLELSGDQTFSPIVPQQPQNSGLQSQDQGMVTSNGNGGFQDSNMSGVGAGPLPTGFGMAPPAPSSTLTEFTKRRNWSQRIIEELKDFLHILTPDGRILYVSPSCKVLTGYEPHLLVGKFIGEYVHPDDSGIFMREFNESIASGNALRFFYRFKKEDGNYTIFECDGHPHISPEPPGSSAYGQTPSGHPLPVTGLCRGLFMMARPYPTRNAALLDSFLEHKIENERLMKRIEELRREEAEENAEQDRIYREGGSHTGATPSESHANASRVQGDGGSEVPAATPNYQGMPPPAKPPISNTALTPGNLEKALSSQKPDSIADKMTRYEANNTHLESIELLTGLRYRDGERSHGISTGDTSPALIRGDAGIAILLDRDRESSKKEKKKLKIADEYVCADCGTLDSPEWRKGPKGPKTLCNACGLRWAKKEKKRGGDDVRTESPKPGGGMMNQQPLPSGLTPTSHTPGLSMHNSTGSGSM